MADTKTSALPVTATVVNNTDFLHLSQSGVDAKVTVERLNRKVTANSVAAQVITASTATVVAGTSLLMPTSVTPNVNTIMQWKIVISKTAAGIAAPVFTLYRGTTGTTSDAVMGTFTGPAQTAAIDVARFDILLTFRSVGAGTAAVAQTTLTMTHNLTATGFANIAGVNITSTSSGFDSTVANLRYSIGCNSGAAAAWTVTQAVAEAVNV